MVDIDAASTSSVVVMDGNELSISQVSARTGITSRTLRHYATIGLLTPSRTGSNGLRYYGATQLVRLQRILLLRELGLSLSAIEQALRSEQSETTALAAHLEWLNDEHLRLERQISSVQKTLKALKKGTPIMSESMFDGFDTSHYQAEVTERWGKEAYDAGNNWWAGMEPSAQLGFKENLAALNRDWTEAASTRTPATSETALALAKRHVDWLTSIPGTPASRGGEQLQNYVLGLAEMYVADPRFAANYGGQSGAEFVRDSLQAYVAAGLP